jgi:hypothetical protein
MKACIIPAQVWYLQYLVKVHAPVRRMLSIAARINVPNGLMFFGGIHEQLCSGGRLYL